LSRCCARRAAARAIYLSVYGALGGGALPIIGSREQVAEKLARLFTAGIDGILREFLSYYDDTIRFEREIMPLLRQLETIK
jgi:alkanesulfonate monooxygenase SsuD/methylene tetrahydromethanopterin reductase-like flavin-dependent oxidoreductase (luciferase family)